MTRATGLEDDDNFIELIRSRAGLGTPEEAITVAADVALRIASALPEEVARQFAALFPKRIEDHIYPNLEARRRDDLTLAMLETELETAWNVDIEKAARLADAVGLTLAERVPEVELEPIVRLLHPDLQRLFPAKVQVA